MTATADARFTTGSVWRHVVVMSLTSSIGLMAIFAVDLIDMVFIAMLGNAALAAAIALCGNHLQKIQINSMPFPRLRIWGSEVRILSGVTHHCL